MISMNYNPIGHNTEVKKKKKRKKINFFQILYCIIVFPIYLILKIKQFVNNRKKLYKLKEERLKNLPPRY